MTWTKKSAADVAHYAASAARRAGTNRGQSARDAVGNRQPRSLRDGLRPAALAIDGWWRRL